MDKIMRRLLNPFVCSASIESGIRFPDIPVFLEEQFGQYGEDIIVVSLLRALCFRDGIDSRTLQYCEIGGNHPFAASASYLLNKVLGMSGVIVEANPRLIDDLARARREDRIVNAAITDETVDRIKFFVAKSTELSSLDRSFVTDWPGEGGGVREEIEVPALSIDALMATEFPERPPVYLSLDIEGMDLRILQSLSIEKCRPYLIQVEPSDHHEPENSRRIHSYLSQRGYDLIARTAVNMIFVDLSPSEWS
jgi:FkbM family methyltransferase